MTEAEYVNACCVCFVTEAEYVHACCVCFLTEAKCFSTEAEYVNACCVCFHTEAEYADELRKHLIALVVEADYQPRGWLANLLLKVKAVVDVTDTQNLDRNLDLLENMLHSTGGP